MMTTFSSYLACLLFCVLLHGGGTILARPGGAAGDEYHRKSVMKKQALPEAIEALIGRGGGNRKTAKEEASSQVRLRDRAKMCREAKCQENKKNKGTESGSDFSTGASSSSSDAWSAVKIYHPNSKYQENKKNKGIESANDFSTGASDAWSGVKIYRPNTKHQENKKNKGTESANDFSTGASSSSSDAWSTARIVYRPNSKAKQEQKKN